MTNAHTRHAGRALVLWLERSSRESEQEWIQVSYSDIIAAIPGLNNRAKVHYVLQVLKCQGLIEERYVRWTGEQMHVYDSLLSAWKSPLLGGRVTKQYRVLAASAQKEDRAHEGVTSQYPVVNHRLQMPEGVTSSHPNDYSSSYQIEQPESMVSTKMSEKEEKA